MSSEPILEPTSFFLSSSEGYGLQTPRACSVVRELRAEAPRSGTCLLVRVRPPIIGQRWSLPEDLEFVVLTARFQGDGVVPSSNRPVSVHVWRPLVPVENLTTLRRGEVEEIGWAETYETMAEAVETAQRASA